MFSSNSIARIFRTSAGVLMPIIGNNINNFSSTGNSTPKNRAIRLANLSITENSGLAVKL